MNPNNIGCLVAKRSSICGCSGIKRSEVVVEVAKTACEKKMVIITK